MSVKITIIGLGRIGASMGMSLGAHKDKITVTGHDRTSAIAQAAKKLGAVSEIKGNLPDSVRGADLVILALPLDEIHDTLQAIADDLREDVLVVDTAPAKAAVAGWVGELLPPKRHYVGLFPALNPQVLQDVDMGVESARADLFQHAVIAVAAPAGAPAPAMKLAADLVTVLGAAPFFTDLDELDGIIASIHTLPQLTAATLMGLALTRPSWDDIRKLAGPAFSSGTSLLASQESAALVDAALQNQANSARVLDELIQCLTDLRTDILAGNRKKLLSDLGGVHQDRRKWLEERHKGDWLAIESGVSSLPASHDFVKQQFFGGIGKLFGQTEQKKGGK